MHEDQQRYSSVADMLYYLPSYYDEYVLDQEATMREKYFGIWQRPTIQWDLECEWNGISRVEAVDKFVVDIKTDEELMLTTSYGASLGSALLGFFGFAGFCFFGIPVVCCMGNEDPSAAMGE